MGIISLQGMEFFAHHGVSDEEQKTGNRYTVDVFIHTDFEDAANSDSIRDTVNYAEVYTLVSVIMAKNTRLLESLAVSIAKELVKGFRQAEKARVLVTKHNPPINGLCEKATVEYEC